MGSLNLRNCGISPYIYSLCSFAPVRLVGHPHSLVLISIHQFQTAAVISSPVFSLIFFPNFFFPLISLQTHLLNCTCSFWFICYFLFDCDFWVSVGLVTKFSGSLDILWCQQRKRAKKHSWTFKLHVMPAFRLIENQLCGGTHFPRTSKFP